MPTADERVEAWLRGQISRPLGDSADLHYRDCPDIVVDSWSDSSGPLSEVTADIRTTIHLRWGCIHGPRRFTGSVWFDGTLSELLDELDDVVTEKPVPFFARHYDAPDGGTKWG